MAHRRYKAVAASELQAFTFVLFRCTRCTAVRTKQFSGHFRLANFQ